MIKKGADTMTIINIIHVGEEALNFDELSEERKREIAEKLNNQALSSVGYKKVQGTDKTAQAGNGGQAIIEGK